MSPGLENLLQFSSADTPSTNSIGHDGAETDDVPLCGQALLRHEPGNADKPALGRSSGSLAQRCWDDSVTVKVLDMSIPASVQLVKNILTYPAIWNATAHDDSPNPEEFTPIIGITYILACCDGEAMGVFTFHPVQYGLLWMAHTAFYPWAKGAAVAAATREGIRMGLQFPGCRNIIGMTPTYNTPAVQSALRNGFHKYCEIPEAVRRGGVWHSVMLSGVVKPQTEANLAGDVHKSQLPSQDAQTPPPPIQKLAISGSIDYWCEKLLAQVEANPHLWNANPERTVSANSPHREADDTWVRYGPRESLKNPAEPHTSYWWDAAIPLNAVQKITAELMDFCDADSLGGVLITRTPAGKQIYPHVDSGWHATYYNLKVYVVLKSNEKCISYAGSMSLAMKAGECFAFNNAVEHGMVNGGDTERITLIICMHVGCMRKT